MYNQEYNGMFPSDYDYYNWRKIRSVKGRNRLKMFGQGTVNIKPDISKISIGVITENKQLEVAQNENAKITNNIIDSIKTMGVLERDIQTQNYDIRIKYDYIDGKQVFRGYEVTNSLKVLVRDINNVGKIIDTAVKNGANTVNNISFIVSDSSKYYREALRLAIEDAQNKALAIAQKLKVRINIVPIEIIEQHAGTSEFSPSITFKSTDGGTPIEVGENKIVATIEGVFTYSEY